MPQCKNDPLSQMSNYHPVKLEFFMLISRLQAFAVCTLNFLGDSLRTDDRELLSRYFEYMDCVQDRFIGVFMRIEQGLELYKGGIVQLRRLLGQLSSLFGQLRIIEKRFIALLAHQDAPTLQFLVFDKIGKGGYVFVIAAMTGVNLYYSFFDRRPMRFQILDCQKIQLHLRGLHTDVIFGEPFIFLHEFLLALVLYYSSILPTKMMRVLPGLILAIYVGKGFLEVHYIIKRRITRQKTDHWRCCRRLVQRLTIMSFKFSFQSAFARPSCSLLELLNMICLELWVGLSFRLAWVLGLGCLQFLLQRLVRLRSRPRRLVLVSCGFRTFSLSISSFFSSVTWDISTRYYSDLRCLFS